MAEYDIFISCKRDDYEIAEKVYSFLTNNGFSVFLASQDRYLMPPTDYMDSISNALYSAHSMIVVSTKKEYLNSEWVKLEWSTFLNEILSGRKNGQIITLVDNIKVNELPNQLRKYESFTLENYEDVLQYLGKPKRQVESNESLKESPRSVNNDAAIGSEVHIEVDLPCWEKRFKEEMITAQPNTDNLIHLNKGKHKLTFGSRKDEQDSHSLVYTVKGDCGFLQVNLTKIRDARLAKEEEERKIIALENAKHDEYGKSDYKKEGYDIFISCKSEDYKSAEKVYKFLTNKNNGYSVFLASQELRKMAMTAYMDSISKALDSAYSMIVISTKKEYLESEWVKLEWSTFLCEILSKRKTGQIMTLVENIEVGELPILLRTFESFTLGNYEDILPYLKNTNKLAEAKEHKNDDKQDANNTRTEAEVHIKTDIACRVIQTNKTLITAQPNTDNLIHLKKGTHELKFVSLDDVHDCVSLVYTIKENCVNLEVNLTKIRNARLAKEQAERRAKVEAERRAKEEAERKRIAEAEDDAKYDIFVENGKWGFKKDGVAVIPAKYDNIWYFHEGLAAVKLYDKWGFIDKTGKEVIPIRFDNHTCLFFFDYNYSFNEGFALVKLNGKWGYIDKSGKEVTSFKYDDAWGFSDGLAKVQLNGKIGYVNTSGKEITSFKYDTVCSFIDGLAKVRLNDKWGFIDKNGKEVAAIKYDEARDFSEGLAAVKLDGKLGYINKNGKEVIPVKFDDSFWVYEFRNGNARVRLDGKWGYIDKEGNFTPDE